MAIRETAAGDIKISTQEPTIIFRRLKVTLPNSLGELLFEVRLECENLFFQLEKIVIKINAFNPENDPKIPKIMKIMENIQNQAIYYLKLSSTEYCLEYRFNPGDRIVEIIISPRIRVGIVANCNAIFFQITELIISSVKKTFANQIKSTNKS